MPEIMIVSPIAFPLAIVAPSLYSAALRTTGFGASCSFCRLNTVDACKPKRCAASRRHCYASICSRQDSSSRAPSMSDTGRSSRAPRRVAVVGPVNAT